uniref:Uncharacterized protein n=1 Tax=Nelumbo nucifera TaxID=4432 RepID=A0A822ZBL0_NELNU|nr:TPA_asm: hypothetical protein HUJ06_013250 [Nelumbo nucifera]
MDSHLQFQGGQQSPPPTERYVQPPSDGVLDRKVTANTTPVDGVFSFDVIVDRATSLSRIYRPAPANEAQTQPGIMELEQPLSTEVVPIIIFFHGGSFAHSSAHSAIHNTLCRQLMGFSERDFSIEISLGN